MLLWVSSSSSSSVYFWQQPSRSGCRWPTSAALDKVGQTDKLPCGLTDIVHNFRNTNISRLFLETKQQMGNLIIFTYGLTFSRHGAQKKELIHCKQHCRWPKGRHTTDHGDWFLPRPTDTFTLDRVVNYNLFSISEQVSFGWFWQITFVGSKMSGCRALARSSLYLGLVSQKATTVWVGWRAEYFVHSAIVLKNTFPLACWILCTLCVCKKILLG